MKDELDIPYAQYKQVTRLGGGRSLDKQFARLSEDGLAKLEALLQDWDPDTTRTQFFILETDGYRMPDSVQKLYGKRYLDCLNHIKRALSNVRSNREFDAMWAELAR